MRPVLLKNLILSPEQSRDLAELLAQRRGINDYENISNDNLLGALMASENDTRIEEIREEIKKLEHKFSRQEVKEIKKNLYEIEKEKRKKGLSTSKKAEKYLNKLEERIYKLNKYYNYDDAEYRGIR